MRLVSKFAHPVAGSIVPGSGLAGGLGLGLGLFPDQLHEMQKIISAEKSDLFDVLAYVAYALPPLTRQERAARAKAVINAQFTSKQQAFLDFVLAHYVQEGVEELDQSKLGMLLNLRYGAISDAILNLGAP